MKRRFVYLYLIYTCEITVSDKTFSTELGLGGYKFLCDISNFMLRITVFLKLAYCNEILPSKF